MKHTVLILAALCSASAFAQGPVVNNANIDNSAAQYQGNVGVNQAAGDQQQQANARAFAIGHDANASTQIRQRLRSQVDPAVDAQANIKGDSFSHGSGALGVNQGAGAANQQANALRISISAQPQSIDDSVLLQQNVALINSSDPTDLAPGHRQVTTSDQAFTGSRGVVQLNQSAGVGNQTANTLSVRVAN
ncbi:adhesin [Pseudomonas entomophila]|uniref:adhesin n=1 Tax=Pseudomonas entomophila TaxID=312306 RepID=UPI001BD0B7E8|nr:adhesin [Pseudomonas entomophila]QVM89154.1 adhesin [Pseudomonas entomophila]